VACRARGCRRSTSEIRDGETRGGLGRWLVNAAAALRRSGDVPYFIVGVEAEPTHFQWMRQHMLDNDIDLEHVELLHAAVAAEDGVVWFHMGQPDAWYGQAIASGAEIPEDSEPSSDEWTPPLEQTIRPVRSLLLATIIAQHERIDIVDLDIQGAEADVLESSHGELDARGAAFTSPLIVRERGSDPCTLRNAGMDQDQ
jgi:FkbM family methyltransferase